MLIYFLYGLFILSCLVIVVGVLLQPGKADAGALFTSSVSTTAFGPRGTQSLLAKITIIAAITFMISALLISFGVGGPRSVMEGATAPIATPTPETAASPETPETATPQQTEGTAAPAASPVTDATPAPQPTQ